MTALVIIAMMTGAFSAGWLWRDISARASRQRFASLPPATRRELRQDQRRKRLGLADIRERTIGCRCTDVEVCRMHRESGGDPLHGRLTDAIAKLGADAEPKPGWKDGVLARVRGGWRRG